MKIVRLTENNGKTAYFDNTFNDEINLPPFSEVALASLSVNVDASSIVISGANNKIYEGATIGTVTLTPETYNLDTYDDLLYDIEASFNENTGHNVLLDAERSLPNSQVGRQWSCSQDTAVTGLGKQGKVSIGYRCANYEGAAEEAFLSSEVVEAGGGSAIDNEYKRSGGVPGEQDAFLAGRVPLTWGCGRFYVKLDTLTDPGDADGGVFIGLTTTDHATLESTPTIEECVFGIRASRPGEPYVLNQEAVVYDDDDADESALHLVVEGDIIGFERFAIVDSVTEIHAVQYTEDGLVVGDRERFPLVSDGDTPEESTVTYNQKDYTRPLYPVVIMLGSATQAIISKVQTSPDALVIYHTPIYKTIIATNGIYGLQNNAVEHIGGFLQFQPDSVGTDTLYTYLGYAQSRVPAGVAFSDMPANAFSWDAGSVFASALAGQGFYVELMTGTCEGYDGETGQRKNILAVIPESDADSKLLYQPGFPIFLEMNNSHPLVLRNIRARVLQVDGSSLPVDGFNSMTLLYKPGKS